MTNWSYQAVNLHVILHVKIGQVNISFIRLYLLCMKFTRHFIIDKMERYIFPSFLSKTLIFWFQKPCQCCTYLRPVLLPKFWLKYARIYATCISETFYTIQVIHAFDTKKSILAYCFSILTHSLHQVLIIWILLLTVNIS